MNQLILSKFEYTPVQNNGLNKFNVIHTTYYVNGNIKQIVHFYVDSLVELESMSFEHDCLDSEYIGDYDCFYFYKLEIYNSKGQISLKMNLHVQNSNGAFILSNNTTASVIYYYYENDQQKEKRDYFIDGCFYEAFSSDEEFQKDLKLNIIS